MSQLHHINENTNDKTLREKLDEFMWEMLRGLVPILGISILFILLVCGISSCSP